MSKATRDKGIRGELEFANEVYRELGVKLVRNLDQVRQQEMTGTDLIPEEHPENRNTIEKFVARYGIEVKRRETLSRGVWWEQAVEQAKYGGLVPLLAYKQNRVPWRIVVPLSEFGVHVGGRDLDSTVELGIPAWAAMVREKAL